MADCFLGGLTSCWALYQDRESSEEIWCPEGRSGEWDRWVCECGTVFKLEA